jgi:hypothetical protein
MVLNYFVIIYTPENSWGKKGQKKQEPDFDFSESYLHKVDSV